MTKNKAFRVLRYTFTTLWWVFLLFSAYLVINFLSAHFRGEVPRVGNYSVVHIVTNSMEPNIETGTYILIKRVPAEDVKANDIICFYSTDPAIYGHPNTHRVVEEPYLEDGELYFVTKGDHNSLPDKEPAHGSKLIGVWVKNLDTLTTFLDFVMQNFKVIVAILAVLGVGATFAPLFLGLGKSQEGKEKEE